MRDVRLNPHMREQGVDAMLALLNGGTLNIYTDTRPSDPTAPDTSQGAVLLGTLNINATAFGASQAGNASANPIATVNAPGPGEGTAKWARAFSAAGEALLDCRIDPDGTGDIVLATYEILYQTPITVVQWVYVAPMGGI
jgi:hypothetical protein